LLDRKTDLLIISTSAKHILYMTGIDFSRAQPLGDKRVCELSHERLGTRKRYRYHLLYLSQCATHNDFYTFINDGRNTIPVEHQEVPDVQHSIIPFSQVHSLLSIGKSSI
jgi:hypothetical protein